MAPTGAPALEYQLHSSMAIRLCQTSTNHEFQEHYDDDKEQAADRCSVVDPKPGAITLVHWS